MKRFQVVALAVAIGIGCFASAAVNQKPLTKTAGIPIPLCPPDDQSCEFGGH